MKMINWIISLFRRNKRFCPKIWEDMWRKEVFEHYRNGYFYLVWRADENIEANENIMSCFLGR
jgi:hypothetical protein